VIGVAPGAGFGAVAALVLPLPLFLYGLGVVQWLAFASGLLTVLIVYLLARVENSTPVTTLLLAAVFPNVVGEIMLGGALATILMRIIKIEQAYSAIGWKSVFLVAGMLQMGIALIKTNAAGIAAAKIFAVFGQFGSLPLVAAIFVATVLLTQMVNGAVAAAIVGPVAVSISQQAGLDPRAVIMAVAMATSMAFITPLGHAVNVLVMSPGGYSFRDYVRVGLPLTIILSIVVMIVLPIFWGL
jgi:di/tricarboxylate transporter